jgi:transcriptional regulator with XRE-family HTH domain
MHSDMMLVTVNTLGGLRLPKTIRELREQAGLTQLQVANQLSITPSTVYGWERRRNEPRASQLKALAKLFGVCMEEIVFEVSDEKGARD